MDRHPLIVTMGVSGSGKSTVGSLLAERLGVPFIDSDDLHPLTNVDKMSAGAPLTDEDRWPWLAAVGEAMAERRDTGVIVACSALRRSYRDAIRNAAGEVRFVHLEGSREVLAERLSQRENHFMPSSLLDSQLRTLEPLDDHEAGVTVDVAAPPDALIDAIVAALDAPR